MQNRKTRELKFGKTGLLRGVRTARTSPHHADVAGRATLGIGTLSASGTVDVRRRPEHAAPHPGPDQKTAHAVAAALQKNKAQER